MAKLTQAEIDAQRVLNATHIAENEHSYLSNVFEENTVEEVLVACREWLQKEGDQKQAARVEALIRDAIVIDDIEFDLALERAEDKTINKALLDPDCLTPVEKKLVERYVKRAVEEVRNEVCTVCL